MTGAKALRRPTERRAAAPAAPSADRRPYVFDKKFGLYSRRLLPGEFAVTGAADEMIVTILGSCVAACIRDPHTGFGGMNHFMLPQSDSGEWCGISAATRYGNYAMEALINAVLKSGCARQDLEIKLFGGANVTAGPSMVGQMNADFVLAYLAAEGLRVVAQDLGGPRGRKIFYVPSLGTVSRVLLRRTSDAVILREERQYGTKLVQEPVEGAIDLFD